MTITGKQATLLLLSLLLPVTAIQSLSGCAAKRAMIPRETSGGTGGHADLSAFFSSVRPPPGNPDLHDALARHHQRSGRHREAIAEFRKVLAIDPARVKAYNGAGVSHDLLGEFSHAIEAYRAALSLDPGQAYLLNNMGCSYLMQRDPDRAISAFEKALSLSPGEPRFHNNLAAAHGEKGEYGKAWDHFLRGGTEAQAHQNMAAVRLRRGMTRDAVTERAAALPLDPSGMPGQGGGGAAVARTAISGTMREHAGDRAGPAFSGPPGAGERETPPEPEAATAPPPERRVIWPADARNPDSSLPVMPAIDPAGPSRGLSGSGDATGPPDGEGPAAGLPDREAPVDPAASASPPVTAGAAAGPLRRDIGIEISNGNGVRGMGKKVGSRLEKSGYPVARLTNAASFNSRHTHIYYLEGYREVARRIAERLPGKQRLIGLDSLDHPSIQVKILLGRDLICHKARFQEKEGS